ncbi:MAG: hypothetical protein KF803_00555 [Cyclobacteriaceae bacterium]|nr:hypothetical protein [Cyclobacteriaceae bacterium]
MKNRISLIVAAFVAVCSLTYFASCLEKESPGPFAVKYRQQRNTLCYY